MTCEHLTTRAQLPFCTPQNTTLPGVPCDIDSYVQHVDRAISQCSARQSQSRRVIAAIARVRRTRIGAQSGRILFVGTRPKARASRFSGAAPCSWPCTRRDERASPSCRPTRRFSPIAPLCTASISHTPARRPCARDQQIRRSRALLNPFTLSSHLLCYVVAATAWIGPNLPRTRFARPLLFNSSTSSLAHASQIPMQEAALDYAQCLFRATAPLLRSHSRQSFPGDDAVAAKPANQHRQLPLHLPWDFRSILRWSCKPFRGRMVASKIGPANG